MVADFIKKQFTTELYTIEYDAEIGGSVCTLFSSGGDHPSFSNTGGKVWKSMRDIKLHLHMFKGDAVRTRHYLEHNPVVCRYTLVGGATIYREVICLLESMLE